MFWERAPTLGPPAVALCVTLSMCMLQLVIESYTQELYRARKVDTILGIFSSTDATARIVLFLLLGTICVLRVVM